MIVVGIICLTVLVGDIALVLKTLKSVRKRKARALKESQQDGVRMQALSSHKFVDEVNRNIIGDDQQPGEAGMP